MIHRPRKTPEGDYLYRGRFYPEYPYDEVEKDEELREGEADRRVDELIERQHRER